LEGWRIILTPSPPLKVLEWGTVGACFFAPPQKPALGDDMGLISLKICWEVARAFLTEAALMVSPLDLVKWRRRQPEHQRLFLSFWPFFVFNLLTTHDGIPLCILADF
jgi:hypothetical protein